ncbi:MAG: bifunctional uridylyltransferase/uridylyl-removing enzyme [Fimbriimonadales bacterium]|nr:MAG: bifunctional uridylyltransferase/uridylyl-removing enzyme [Fimbriimonadales bacterium]
MHIVVEQYLSIAQQLITARRHLIDALLDHAAPIDAWMAQYTQVLDNTLRALHQRAWTAAAQEIPPPPRSPLALFATGGYGRRELAPYSDIDLTFVPAQEGDPFTERLVKHLFQAMMQVFYTDARLKVGYAYRLMDDLDALDHKTRTGLLEMRPVEGDAELIEAFTGRFWRCLDPTGFTLERYRECQARWAKLGEGILRSEPHLKEGRGGLRDRHTLNWMAQARYGVPHEQVLPTLIEEGILSQGEADDLEHATRTLQRYRAYLHAISGEAREQLTLTRQNELAERLGVPRTDLMGAVYNALTVHARLTARGIERLVNAPLVLGVGLDSVNRQITPAPALDKEPPEWRLLCFLLAQRYQLGLSQAIETRLEVCPHALSRESQTPRATDEAMGTPTDTDPCLPPDPAAVGAALRELLSRPGEVYRVLEPMARLGVLGWAFPPFRALMSLPAGDPTHDYTVGEHTLQAIRLLDSYAQGEGNPLWRTLLEQLPAPELLYMALLLHDAGKVDPTRPHAEVGAEQARQSLSALGWSAAEIAEVEFLVLHHLLMAQTARQRDLHLPETIREFTRIVNTPERLQMLYLLTCADTQAVGERIWTPAQASFLMELYRRSMRALEEGMPEETPALTVVRKRLQRALAKHPIAETLIEKHIEQMPSGYLLNTTPEQISLHIHYIERVRAGEGPVVEFHNAPDLPYTELTLCTFDDPKPGLLSKIAGVLYAHEVEVASARVLTREDAPRVALDTLGVTVRSRPLSPNQCAVLERALRQVLTGERAVGELLREHGKDPDAPLRVSQLQIHDDASDAYTVVDWHTPPDLGALYRTAHALSQIGWNIHSARFGLWAGRAVLSFYCTDAEGRKIPPTEYGRLSQAVEAV